MSLFTTINKMGWNRSIATIISNTTNHIQIVCYFMAFMTLFQSLYYILRKHSKKFQSLPHNVQTPFVSRLVSTVHACLSTLFALFILYNEVELSQNKLLYKSFSVSLTLNLYIGYVLYDMLIMVAYKEIFDISSMVHHVVSCAAFYTSTTAGVFPFIALARLTSEGSTPFINMRWMLLKLKMADTKLYFYNGIAVLVSFGLVRIMPIVPIWYTFYQLTLLPMWPNVHLFHKFICVFTSLPLDVLNIYWYNKIVRMALQTVNGKKVHGDDSDDDDAAHNNNKVKNNASKKQVPYSSSSGVDSTIASRLLKDSNNNISHHIE